MRDFSLKSVAQQKIREKIINYEIKGGERIREDLLAEELGMSRTPVREAINQLVMERLIVKIPRKGLYCVELSIDMIEDLLDLRNLLEVYAVESCIDLLQKEDLLKLKLFAEKYDQNRLKKTGAGADADDLFHLAIVKCSGNKVLQDYYRSMINYFHIMKSMSAIALPLGDEAAQSHYQIINCIEKKDKAGARGEMTNHIAIMRRVLLDNNFLSKPESQSVPTAVRTKKVN